jgi:aspartyl-tRNA(Asn)/glutamyl-tRNA(Gln) amidotransferase subunit A
MGEQVRCYPCAWSFDNVGPITRTTEDPVLLLSSISGWDHNGPATSRKPVPDPAAVLSQLVEGLKVGVLKECLTYSMEPEVVEGFQAALGEPRDLGMEVEQVSIPEVESAIGGIDGHHVRRGHSLPPGEHARHLQQFGPDVRAWLERETLIATTGLHQRPASPANVGRPLPRPDEAVLRDNLPHGASNRPRLGQAVVQYEGYAEASAATATHHTRLFNLANQPATSVSCGFAPNGLPFGMQIATAPFDEATALCIAHAYQDGRQLADNASEDRIQPKISLPCGFHSAFLPRVADCKHHKARHKYRSAT